MKTAPHCRIIAFDGTTAHTRRRHRVLVQQTSSMTHTSRCYDRGCHPSCLTPSVNYGRDSRLVGLRQPLDAPHLYNITHSVFFQSTRGLISLIPFNETITTTSGQTRLPDTRRVQSSHRSAAPIWPRTATTLLCPLNGNETNDRTLKRTSSSPCARAINYSPIDQDWSSAARTRTSPIPTPTAADPSVAGTRDLSVVSHPDMTGRRPPPAEPRAIQAGTHLTGSISFDEAGLLFAEHRRYIGFRRWPNPRSEPAAGGSGTQTLTSYERGPPTPAAQRHHATGDCAGMMATYSTPPARRRPATHH